jgi:predicted nucleotidyltransferase
MTPGFDAAELFARLHEAGVRYVVIGGFAVIAHGAQRYTKDLDICPDPDLENLTRLARLLADLEAHDVGDFSDDEMPYDPTEPSALAEGGNFRLITNLGDVDIMQWVPGIPEDHAYPVLAPAATVGDFDGIPVAVCSIEHLLLMKRAAGRPVDLEDLSRLEQAHGSSSSPASAGDV